ncbi:MAG: sensor histidine kinase [Flavisolibacter sp.]
MKRSYHIKRARFYFWVSLSYLVLWLLIDLGNYPDTFIPRIFNNIWRLIWIVALNYIFFEHSLPYVRKRKSVIGRVLLFLVVLWVQLMLFSFGLFAWRGLGILIRVYTPLKDFHDMHAGVNYVFPYAFMSLFYFGIGRHIHDHIQLRQSAQQLRIEKQEAELHYLRSQTHPHFLFNTLNNIYSLSREKSELAPESILRLSKILRFMLYETSGDYIAVEQELKILNDYISLEKLRYDESLRVNFNHNVEDMKQSIPPLLLIPLVENAFKHGVSETRNRPYVDIHLSLNNRQLLFVVKNSTEPVNESRNIKENIGLSNLRRQLELLYKEYNLTTQQGAAEFIASLKINLGSHV